MRLYHPHPDPLPDPGIYVVKELLSQETWKAVEITTASRIPPSPLFFTLNQPPAPSWETWVNTEFSLWMVPALVQALEAARLGVLELAEQDRQFASHLSPECHQASTTFGLSLLEANLGAKHLPEVAKMHRLVIQGKSPGHASMILALRSVIFGVSTVNTMVVSLFCEWAGSRADGSIPSPERRGLLQQDFAAANPLLPRQIATWLAIRGDNAFQLPSRT